MPLPRSLPQSAKSGGGRRSAAATRRVLAGRYKVEQRMGSGAFGTAYLVVDLESGNERKVLKQIEVGDLLPDETVGAVKEAQLLAKLDHPSIVRFHDSFLEKDLFCIVTELCEGGDLDQKISQWRESGQSFEETLIVDWFIQLTAAIMYIHERRILHRDIKTRNIFLKRNLIKLGDFGISRLLLGTTEMASTFTGTPHYMSPEALKQSGYNSKSDIWSLGVVLYEMCTLQRAFPGSNLMAVMYSIVEGVCPRLPERFTPHLRALFDQMLDKDPRRRPSAQALLQEPFLQQRMASLRERMAGKFTPETSKSSSSSSKSRVEAQAIAEALTPVKKKSLQATNSIDAPLTPRQRLALKKQEMADSKAEERRRLAAENFSEGIKRFSEHKKKQDRVVPPWVAEHPDVFSDPNFSLTQLDSKDCFSLAGSLEQEEEEKEQQQQQHQQEEEQQQQQQLDCHQEQQQQHKQKQGQQQEQEMGQELNRKEAESGGEGEGERQRDSDGEETPDYDDPELYYSQLEDDFEELSSSEEEYEALMECIEDALDLPNQPVPESPPLSPQDHDDLCPFSSSAREKKIQLLRLQCTAIYGEDLFGRIHSHLKEARSRSVPHEDEAGVVAGLRALTANTRDCFLVDQLVFLEKQV